MFCYRFDGVLKSSDCAKRLNFEQTFLILVSTFIMHCILAAGLFVWDDDLSLFSERCVDWPIIVGEALWLDWLHSGVVREGRVRFCGVVLGVCDIWTLGNEFFQRSFYLICYWCSITNYFLASLLCSSNEVLHGRIYWFVVLGLCGQSSILPFGVVWEDLLFFGCFICVINPPLLSKKMF